MKTITDFKLKFDEKEHSYTYNGVPMISVTQFIEQFKPKFDEKTISKFVAKKRKVSQKAILKEWQEAKEIACDLGNSVHKYAENKVLKKEQDEPINDKDKILRASVDDYFNKHPSLKPYLTEVQLCLPEYQLAGTADLIMQSDDGKMFLYDHKTSKEIRQKGFKNEKMFCPLAHLDNCNYVKYSLQLYIYVYMLKKRGCEINGCYIIHYTKDGWKEYKALDVENEVEAMMQFRLMDLHRQKELKKIENELKK